MPLGSHEAHELNELLLSCTNSIQSMALFINQATDPILKSMITRHYDVHVQDYNMKVEYANRFYSQDQLNVPAMPMSSSMPMLGTQQYPPLQPRVQLQQLNDRAIATSYLLTLKRAGREYAWSAFECSTPQLRSFLESAFQMCSHQAYEVWQYMAAKGYYPTAQAPQEVVSSMQQIYKSVPEHQPGQMYS
ncbi:spore coat protein CotF [Paenibacillus rhizosphaerae]|uniref:Spore coat protein CotF n=1 Tax=Paenibacillus rhizosphaerae TaxID=297318 RepID=A0A839TTI7_9BACL|nr:spore coat protein [Paenibacillus rhizosphaerae]MBB3128950.1 spore coat protein CotF [Paenibacillus rhizosphaerae]